MNGAGTNSEVAPGVFRLGSRWVNFYLVIDGDEAILVDAGYPDYFGQLEHAVGTLGKQLGDTNGVLVTHHHVDHTGTAEAVRTRAGADVFVGAADAAKVRGEIPSHPPTGFYREVWRPSMIRYLAHTVAAGGARYRAVAEVTTPTETARPLDLPGRPLVVPTPGHTAGHYSLVLEERGILFTGDAMVAFDYASGEDGLSLHRFNEDREGALASLDRLEAIDAEVLLFGHGDPWRGEPSRAVEMARRRELTRNS